MSKRTKILISIGLLLIFAAAVLAIYNIVTDVIAGKASRELVSELDTMISEGGSADEVPDYVLNPNIEMPTVELDGTDYIGLLVIPSLELELPVASDWNYKQLRISPCRYTGSAYLDSLVICGHNYSTHFGNLKDLYLGSSIIFIDADQNRFVYKVVAVEELPPTAVEEMTIGDWDLSLFTCTLGGRSRVTVRCMLDN